MKTSNALIDVLRMSGGVTKYMCIREEMGFVFCCVEVLNTHTQYMDLWERGCKCLLVSCVCTMGRKRSHSRFNYENIFTTKILLLHYQPHYNIIPSSIPHINTAAC